MKKKSNLILSSLFLLIIFLCGIIIIGCSKKGGDNPTAPTSISQSLWPIVVGNSWTYTDTSFASNSISSPQVFTVTEQTSIQYQGKSLDVCVISGRSDVYWRMENGEVYQYYPDPNPLKALCLKSSVKKGDTFQAQFIVTYPTIAPNTGNVIPSPSISSESWECISTNEQVTTQAGKFSCYVFKITGTGFYQNEYYYDYYSMGIGEVFFKHVDNGSIVNNRTLVSYTVK